MVDGDQTHIFPKTRACFFTFDINTSLWRSFRYNLPSLYFQFSIKKSVFMYKKNYGVFL